LSLLLGAFRLRHRFEDNVTDLTLMPMNLPQSTAVIALHDESLSHAVPQPTRGPNETASVWHWIKTNHDNNCQLWAEEDLARRTRVSDSEIAANKRRIDGFNQARNDATERVDELLLVELGLVNATSARSDTPLSTAESVGKGRRLNSETAGSMVDRLSILSLKINAMRAQTQRTDVDDAHRQTSRAKLERLLEQRSDLAACFDELLLDCQAGRAYFKVYRQFKMYNDPQFNPALVAERASSS
jgi:Protein of unknown function (DUF4254)